jgi:hypothetical protein
MHFPSQTGALWGIRGRRLDRWQTCRQPLLGPFAFTGRG